MDLERVIRFAPLSGVGMVVLWLVAIPLIGWDYYPSRERALAIVSEDPARVQLAATLAGYFAPVLLLIFSAALYGALREREGGSGWLSILALGGGLLSVAAMVIGYGVLSVAAGRAARPFGLSAEEAAVMLSIHGAVLANLLSIGLLGLVGATGLVALRTRLFPAWLGWTSVVFAIGLLTPLHWIFEGLSTVWIVVVSILLFREPSMAQASSSRPATPRESTDASTSA